MMSLSPSGHAPEAILPGFVLVLVVVLQGSLAAKHACSLPLTPALSPRGEGEQRKAWDLNPHDLAVARFSKPARPAVSGYLP